MTLYETKRLIFSENWIAKNGLSGDELAVISSFCLIERVENKELKKYEDLEEQGKLLKLPCAVGDTLYSVGFRKTYCEKIENEYVANRGLLCALCEKESDCQSKTEYFIEETRATLPIIVNLINGSDDFTIYLTHQEAEDKLKEIEGKK